RANNLDVPLVPSTTAAAITALGVTSTFWIGGIPRSAAALDIAVITAFVALAAVSMARWRGGSDALAQVAAAIFPSLYLGVPIGAMASIEALHGPEKLFLLMVTIIISDTAQYYTGRLLGRTPLAPAISPKKTREGAIGGFVFGALSMIVIGNWWLPSIAAGSRALLGVAIVALGIAGDLFES